ncbi:MAG: hypothetical protein IT210_22860 [Armatimonadetes bacterium]|nr:hypothetical protein [Armatimonadota bacterium]
MSISHPPDPQAFQDEAVRLALLGESRFAQPVAETRLERRFVVAQPDPVWWREIPSIPTDEGWP